MKLDAKVWFNLMMGIVAAVMVVVLAGSLVLTDLLDAGWSLEDVFRRDSGRGTSR